MKKTVLAILLLALAGCAALAPSKRDIARKSVGVDTKQQLLAALGGPDDAMRMGLVEQWTYHARDGEVMFVIIGDQVTLQASDDLLKFEP
ncbi:MAG TPA: hypothetical protein VM661_10835 [Candidatus Sulfotelmatobacter sp.]|jgi:hypothetical protein|nr:hypothetical protein [Candidatus Sulfotelmatobacter sp.]